jgi:imidazolonepropionase-like amidohydrolase
VIRGVTLVLGTTVTIGRGPLLLQGARTAAAAEGDIAPPSGAVGVDAAGQFVSPRQIDSRSHLGGYPTPGAEAYLDGSDGRERQQMAAR